MSARWPLSARLLLCIAGGGLALGAFAAGDEQDFEDGKALGQAQATQTQNGLKDGSAKTTVPNYTEDPPEAAYYQSKDLRTPTANQRAACATNPRDTTCAAVQTGTAQRPNSGVTAADPALAGATVAADPTLILGDIANTYSACSVGDAQLVSPATFTRRSCTLDTGPWTRYSCDKTLTVHTKTQFTCVEGTWYQRADGHLPKDIAVSAQVLCEAARTDGKMRFALSAGELTTEVELPMDVATPPTGSLPPKVATFDLRQQVGLNNPSYTRVEAYAEGTGCDQGHCQMGFHFFLGWRECRYTGGGQFECGPDNPIGGFVAGAAGSYSIDPGAGHTLLNLQMAQPTVTAVASEIWDNGCAALEAQTAVLPADGVNPDPPLALPASTQTAISQCSRSASVCVDGPGGKWIEGTYVERGCWAWYNTFDCTALIQPSTCTDPALRACSQAGTTTCLSQDASGRCLHAQADYDCPDQPATYSPALNCGAQSYCAGGSCYDKSYTANQDLGYAVSMLEAQREAGAYFDPQTMRVFKGYSASCSKQLYGLKNCCKDGGTDSFLAFTDPATAVGAVEQLGRQALSDYTYDGLFTDQAPEDTERGFAALQGTEFDDGLQGIAGGDTSVDSFMFSMSPSAWSQALYDLTIAGLMACPKSTQYLAMKRDAGLCHELGDYCSSRDLFGSCITRTQAACCFNSRLSRIINEQGRPQLARGWGSPQEPQCDGFTIEELQSLDWSVMDLSEFYQDIQPTELDQTQITDDNLNQTMSCYYGAGGCAH
jgi:conjugal transfer mating pair stabilization protein TraN